MRNLRVREEERDVSDVFRLTRNMADAGSRNGRRLCRQNIIHDRKIVNREVPNYIHVVLKEPQINAHSIVVVDLAEGVLRDEFTNLSYRTRVDEGVIYHQDSFARLRLFNQLNRLLRVGGERLFDQHMFISLERRYPQLKMR